jgi:hypothetical protein
MPSPQKRAMPRPQEDAKIAVIFGAEPAEGQFDA